IQTGVYLPQGKQGICLGRHFLGGGIAPQKKGHMQHGDRVGSERGCGLLDDVCRALLSFLWISRAVKVSVFLSALSMGRGGGGGGLVLVGVRLSSPGR
ncbi:unnamed protein product, partial [Staurois parvus]